MQYHITNATSGHYFGIYSGDTPEDAVRALNRDAGYSSDKEVLDVLGHSWDEMMAGLIVVEVE